MRSRPGLTKLAALAGFGLALLAAALAMIQCSPLRDGIVPVSADYRVSQDAFSIALIATHPA